MGARRKAKQDRRRRRKAKQGSTTVTFERFIAALEANGQTVHRLSPGLALSACPACAAEGKFNLLEIRALPGGVDVSERGDGDG